MILIWFRLYELNAHQVFDFIAWPQTHTGRFINYYNVGDGFLQYFQIYIYLITNIKQVQNEAK